LTPAPDFDIKGTFVSCLTPHDMSPYHNHLEIHKSPEPFLNLPTCGICLESIIKTVNPVLAAKTPTSSSRLVFGLSLPCPSAHTYCLDCIIGHIRSRLDGEGARQAVFPIRCPECPPQEYSIDDEVAARVLEGELLERWYFCRVLESVPKVSSYFDAHLSILQHSAVLLPKSTLLSSSGGR
jgi:hypothetical protein